MVGVALPTPSMLGVGDSCEVFSASVQAWARATVVEVDEGEARVRYSLPGGGSREKWVRTAGVELRAPLGVAEPTEPPSPRSSSDGPATAGGWLWVSALNPGAPQPFQLLAS